MKRTILLMLFMIIFFSKCSVKDQIIVFEHISDIELENIEQENIPNSIDFINDDKRLHLLFKNSHRIVSYDLETSKIVDTLNFLKLTKHPASFRLFHYRDSDSIFLYSGVIGPVDYDSTFYLINKNVDVKEVYSLKDAPVKHSGNLLKNTPSYIVLREQDLYYSENNIYFLLKKQSFESIGDSSFLMNDATLAGFIDTKENKFNPIPIDYLHLDTGMHYDYKFQMINLALSHKGNPLFSYGYTPSFYEFDLKRKALSVHRIKSKFIDTIPYTKSAIDYKPIPSPKSGMYNQIFYNHGKNQYIRLLSLPRKTYNIEDWKVSLVLFDTSYNYIAEGILPAGLDNRALFFEDDKVWFWNYKKTFDSDKKIIFSAYKLNVVKGKHNVTPEKASNNVSDGSEINKSINDYVREKMNIDDHKVALIIIPTDKSCPACSDFVLNYYSQNYKNFKDKPIYILIGGNNKTLHKDILNKAHIKEEMMSKIIFDHSNQYSKYTEYFFNIKLFILNGKQTLIEEEYNPDDLFKVQIRITDFLNSLN